MNKKQAEIYVVKSLDLPKVLSKRSQYGFLLAILFFSGIALLINRKTFFFPIVIIDIILSVGATFFCAKRKPELFKSLLLIAIQFTAFCLIMNCFFFGLLIISNRFMLWEFLLSISLQLLALVTSIPIVIKHAERFVPKYDMSISSVLVGSVAGLTSSTTMLLCRIFSPSPDLLASIMVPLLNLMVCLISFGIVAAIYRAYLIKKYNISDIRE